MRLIKKNLPYMAVLVLSFGTIKPLASSGFFPMHDDTQPARVFEMYQALKDGQFPVRWVKDLGYGFGYPLFNFYSPLPYYIGASFMFLGADEIAATKLLLSIGLSLAGIAMYYLGQHLWGKAGGVISAVLYMYAPYHAVQVYVRGAIGELYAYATLPFIFYFLANKKLPFGLRIVAGGIAWAVLILAHNISAMLALIFLGLWALYLILVENAKTRIAELKLFGTIMILGLGLAAFFWLPALLEAKFTQVDLLIKGGSDFRQHFLYLKQLWDWPWGYAGSAPGLADGMSFKIGKIHLMMALLASFSLIIKKTSNNRKLLYFIIPASLLALVLMLVQSRPIWELLKPLAFVQYPWRLLVFLLFFVSLLGGCVIHLIRGRKTRILLTLILLSILILVNNKYFTPQFIYEPEKNAFSALEKLNWEISKISDEYMTPNFIRPATPQDLAALSQVNNAIIEREESKSHRQKLLVFSELGELFQLKIADFPGWKIVLDEVAVEAVIINGILYTQVPPGRHLISAYLTNTPIRFVGNMVSLLSLVGVFAVLILSNKRYYFHEKR